MLKAICLWQPWAHLMATGNKENETRSWPTKYRGDLAICAAIRPMDANGADILFGCFLGDATMEEESMAYGAVIAVVTLSDCVTTELATQTLRWPITEADDDACVVEEEYCLGNYGPGRFAWLTTNLRRLKHPVPVKSRQGLFNLPDDIEAKVRLQLASGETSNPSHHPLRAVDPGEIG